MRDTSPGDSTLHSEFVPRYHSGKLYDRAKCGLIRKLPGVSSVNIQHMVYLRSVWD